MKKKIDLFWYWFIFVVAFVLCFFVVNDKNVNAYHLNENGNLVSDNLLDMCIFYRDDTITSNGVTTSFDSNTCYLSSTGVVATGNRWFNITNNRSIVLAPGTYTLSLNQTLPNGYSLVFRFANIGDFYLGSYNNWVNTKTFDNSTSLLYVFIETPSSGVSVDINDLAFQIVEGDVEKEFEPYGTWYSENYVGDLATGVISFNSASLTYDNRDYGTSHFIADVSSYIDSSFGYLYFERLWQYLDTLTSSEYENAWLTLQFNNKMNLNTTYILSAMFNNGNYGVGAKFYQGDKLVLDVTNWHNNDYAYCNETSGATCSVELSKFVNVGDFPSEQNSFTYFDKIVVWSGDTDKRTGSFGFQNISYNQGYNSGYNIGYSTGNSNGEKIGYNNGYNNGYLYGYEKGVDAVEGTDNTLVGLVGGILTAPVNMLKTIFDFEFLGINLTHFIFSIVSLFIVIWLIKIFL